MKTFLLKVKAILIDKNVYFPLQLLFIWFLYRILGFAGVSLFLRVVISIGVFFVLFLNWINIIAFIVNNVVFQYFIYVNIFIINSLIQSKLFTFFVAFTLAFICCLTDKGTDIFIIGEVMVFKGHINIIFICLFLLVFVKTFSERVFLKEAEGGVFCVCIDSPNCFVWFYIVDLMASFFEPDVLVENKIGHDFLNDIPFLHFPFSFSLLEELAKPENDYRTFFKNNGGPKLKDEKAKEAYRKFISNRSANFNKYIQEQRIRYNNFYKLAYLGFFVGFVFGNAYLNGMLF